MVDSGLGADDEQAELIALMLDDAEHAARGFGCERDRIFAGLGDGHLAGAEALRELCGIDAACACEILDVDVATRHCDRERLDSDSILHTSPFTPGPGIARADPRRA